MHKTRICVLPLCLAALSLAGCAVTPPTTQTEQAAAPDQAEIVKTLWHGSQGGWVYRVDAETAAPRLAQPVQLDASWLRDYLASLEVTHRRGDDEVELSLFNDKQLDHLVPALVNGLAHAQPNEEVVFAVAGPLPGARLFDQTVATTGRAFVSNGRLNIIFGSAQETVFDAPAQATYVPGSRTHITLERGYDVHSSQWAGDSRRRDWVTIEVQQGHGALPALPQSQPVATQTGDTGQARMNAASARDKLEALKQMYRDDLITREEYRQEREQVLDNF